jgi:5-methylcytosine-specific restriction endonuclease McrA
MIYSLMKKCENPLIPEITKSFRERSFNLSDIELPSGLTKVCVWCLGPLAGKRYRWCSDDCTNSAFTWANPQKSYGLGVLLIRQDWKCKVCSFDYGTIVESFYSQKKAPYGTAKSKDTWRTELNYWVVEALKRVLYDTDRKHSPEVDHIIPISKGGQSLGLDNHDCKCYTCHKAKTKIDNSGKRIKKCLTSK